MLVYAILSCLTVSTGASYCSPAPVGEMTFTTLQECQEVRERYAKYGPGQFVCVKQDVPGWEPAQ